MADVRLIARLDVKGPNLIKGVQLEGLRVIGPPQEYAKRYYEQGADEIIYIDCVASLYGREPQHEIVRRTAENVFVPFTAGGGIRSIVDAARVLRDGADKVAVNTAAVARPELITDIAVNFGSQSVVLGIQAKQVEAHRWEAFTHGGREPTGLDAVEWAVRGAELGAGEILLTSVDREGTRKGFDVNLVKAVTSAVSIPVIASGGMGRSADAVDVVRHAGADAVAMADILHYRRASVGEIKAAVAAAGLDVRLM